MLRLGPALPVPVLYLDWEAGVAAQVLMEGSWLSRQAPTYLARHRALVYFLTDMGKLHLKYDLAVQAVESTLRLCKPSPSRYVG